MTAVPPTLAVRRFALVAIVVPAVITLASLVIQLIALPHVPNPIAIHWGPAGTPDGFAAPWVQLVLTPVVGFGIPLLIAISTLPGLRRGDRGPTYRMLGAFAAGMSMLFGVLMAWTFVAQVGLADAHDAPSVVPVLLGGLAAAAVAGVGAWLVQPKQEVVRTTSAPAEQLVLAPGESAAWFGVTGLGRGSVVAISAACIVMVLATLLLWFTGAPIAVTIGVAVLAVIVTVLAASTSVFHVQVDAAGLTVRSPLGFPRFRVALSDVRAVAVTDVSPMGEFGGYGIRSAIGAFGIVLRKGPAIDVTRTSGKRFVVTVDDAQRGAALLEALMHRQDSAKA